MIAAHSIRKKPRGPQLRSPFSDAAASCLPAQQVSIQDACAIAAARAAPVILKILRKFPNWGLTFFGFMLY